MFIDTHCHLDFPEFDHDRKEVIQRARDAGLQYLVNIGSSLEGSRKSIELAAQFDFIYATVGIHPHEADNFDAEKERELKNLANAEKVVAIGEIGLDYFKNYSTKENQRLLFTSLLKLAKDSNLPLVIHSRNAREETMEALKKSMPIRAVLHCFSGEREFMEECLSLGFFISFTCNITYKKAGNLRELVKDIPLDRLLLETDAPFLAPEGQRGKRNEPANVKLLSEEVARIREITREEAERVTTENARKFFNI